VLGQQEYRIVVLPQTPVLALGAVETLRRFVRGGGTLIAIGSLPTLEAGGDHAGLRRALDRLRPVRVADPAAAAAAVVTAGGAAAQLTPSMPEVRVLRLERGRERAFVVTNERAVVVDVTATFPTTGVPEIWDPETGTVEPAGVWQHRDGSTAVSLRLEPKATQLVVFRMTREPAHAVSSTAPVQRVRIQGRNAIATLRVNAPGTVTVVATDGQHRYQGSANVTDALTAIPLIGEWLFRFDRAGAPEIARPLGSWTTEDSTYSGSAWYEKAIVLDAATLTGRRWMLDLGDVRDVAEIVINGSAIGSRLWTPYRADITPALRPDGNVIRVRVTNTGANARGQALTSGLLGPVFLRPERLVHVAMARS
jgi:hypothetical protein